MYLFDFSETKKRRVYIRDAKGRFCTKSDAEISHLKKEIFKLQRRNLYLNNEAEKYQRMALSLSKRLSGKFPTNKDE